MHLVYCYTNLINNKKYVGQTNIAKQLNLSAATVRKVNNGQIKKMVNLFPEKTFPLRKVNQ